MKLRPRPKRMELLCALILLCVPAMARAEGTDFSLADEGGGSSLSANTAQRAVRHRADLIVAATAGPLASEPSTGLLLLLGVGLIGAASLIRLKIKGSDSVDGVENTGEIAIRAGTAWKHGGPRARRIVQMSTKSKRGTASPRHDIVAGSAAATDEYARAAMAPRFGNYSSYRATATGDRGQHHNALLGLTTK